MSQEKADYAAEIDERPDQLPDDQTVDNTVDALEANGFEVVVTDSADKALETIQSQISDGALMMNGHSTTLEDIGFVDHLTKGDHEWESLEHR